MKQSPFVVGIDPGQMGAEAFMEWRRPFGGVRSVQVTEAPWRHATTRAKTLGRKKTKGGWMIAGMIARAMHWTRRSPKAVTHVLLEAPAMGVKAGIVSGLWRGVIEAVSFFEEHDDQGSLRLHIVPAQTWKKALGLHGKGGIERTGGDAAKRAGAEWKRGKQESIELCQRLYPHVNLSRKPGGKPDDNFAEAVLIAHYGATVLLPSLKED